MCHTFAITPQIAMPSEARDKQKFGAPMALTFQTNCLAVPQTIQSSPSNTNISLRGRQVYIGNLLLSNTNYIFVAIREMHAFRFLTLNSQVRRSGLVRQDEDA